MRFQNGTLIWLGKQWFGTCSLFLSRWLMIWYQRRRWIIKRAYHQKSDEIARISISGRHFFFYFARCGSVFLVFGAALIFGGFRRGAILSCWFFLLSLTEKVCDSGLGLITQECKDRAARSVSPFKQRPCVSPCLQLKPGPPPPRIQSKCICSVQVANSSRSRYLTQVRYFASLKYNAALVLAATTAISKAYFGINFRGKEDWTLAELKRMPVAYWSCV
jgi:hypothetical protein